MAPEPPNPSAETQDHRDPLGAAGIVVRRRPRVSWTDGAGAHEIDVEGRVVLGSAAGVDVVVADPTVSRIHAELELQGDGLWLRDLGSRNGSFVDGIRVGSARIPDGATVRVGGTDLAVKYTRVPTAVKLWPEEFFGPLVGRSVAMRELFARLAQLAAADATVLVQGETGTGKELVARAIHEASARAAGPLVVVDCAALPEQLLEAELFGHARGAFTGAVAARAGAFEAAHGGTVFLDEVGELPLAVQPKLLRALESRAVRRVGETQYRAVDLRVVSATHRDLRTMVNQGAFREDLYFRLAVLPVTVPPLRERADDVPLLVAHFLAERGRGGALDPALVRELVARPWTGNVRELRNFVERALALGPREALALLRPEPPSAGPERAGASVAPPLLPSAPRAATVPAGADVALPPEVLGLTLNEARARWAAEADDREREYLRRLLALHQNNVSATAQAAGLNRTYLHRLIRRHGL